MITSLSNTLKNRIVKTLVWSVALYGTQTGTLRKDEKRRLDELEMWIWKRMEKIAWTDWKMNVEDYWRGWKINYQ